MKTIEQEMNNYRSGFNTLIGRLIAIVEFTDNKEEAAKQRGLIISSYHKTGIEPTEDVRRLIEDARLSVYGPYVKIIADAYEKD